MNCPYCEKPMLLACPAPTFHVGGGHFRKTPYTLP